MTRRSQLSQKFRKQELDKSKPILFEAKKIAANGRRASRTYALAKEWPGRPPFLSHVAQTSVVDSLHVDKSKLLPINRELKKVWPGDHPLYTHLDATLEMRDHVLSQLVDHYSSYGFHKMPSRFHTTVSDDPEGTSFTHDVQEGLVLMEAPETHPTWLVYIYEMGEIDSFSACFEIEHRIFLSEADKVAALGFGIYQGFQANDRALAAALESAL